MGPDSNPNTASAIGPATMARLEQAPLETRRRPERIRGQNGWGGASLRRPPGVLAAPSAPSRHPWATGAGGRALSQAHPRKLTRRGASPPNHLPTTLDRVDRPRARIDSRSPIDSFMNRARESSMHESKRVILRKG